MRTYILASLLAAFAFASPAVAGNGIVESSNGLSANLVFQIQTVPGQQTVCLDSDGNFTVTCAGHSTFSGPAPAIVQGFGQTTGGSLPVLISTSNDNAGRLVVGSGGATSGTLTFASSWGYAPICAVQDETTSNTMRATPASNGTTLTITGTMVGNDVLSYQCVGIPTPSSGPPSPAYYVSANGSDSNNGLSTSTPFQTFGAAQTAMRAQPSTGIKTTFIMSAGGNFTPGSTFTLTSADNNTRWQANGTDQPIIDGGGTLNNIWFLNTTTNITIQGLTFQHTTAAGNASRAAIFMQSATSNNIIANHFSNTNEGILLQASNNNLISGNQLDNAGNGDTTGGTCSAFPGGATVNCAGSAMELDNTSNGNTVQYNLINGATGQNTHGGCIYMHGTNNNLITHNYCENSNGMGIGIEDFGSTTHNSNNVISFNIIHNSNTSSSDSGGIYLLARDQPNVGGTTVDHNYVDFPAVMANSNQIRGLYLDDCTSNSIWTNNIVVNGGAGTHSGGGGGSIFQVHVGSNNTLTNNFGTIAASATQAILTQSDGGTGTCSTTMTGNIASDNIFLAASGTPTAVTALHTTGSTQLTVQTIELWQGSGGAWNGTSGVSGVTFSGISLTNPLFVDLGTVNPTTKMLNFGFQAGSPAPGLGINAIDQSQIGLVNPTTAHWPYVY